MDGAIFLHCMAFWTAKNRANGRHFHEGRYWTYNTMKAFTELFPFWSRRQIERIVAGLKETGALLTGNFSEDKTDRTLWYALGDKVLEAYGESAPPISPNGEMDFTEPCTPEEGAPPISPNGEMDFTEPCTPFPQTGKCIKGTVIRPSRSVYHNSDPFSTLLCAFYSSLPVVTDGFQTDKRRGAIPFSVCAVAWSPSSPPSCSAADTSNRGNRRTRCAPPGGPG